MNTCQPLAALIEAQLSQAIDHLNHAASAIEGAAADQASAMQSLASVPLLQAQAMLSEMAAAWGGAFLAPLHTYRALVEPLLDPRNTLLPADLIRARAHALERFRGSLAETAANEGKDEAAVSRAA